MRPSDPSAGPAKARRRWKSAAQFGLALAVVLGLGLGVDPAVEYFRRKGMRSGWQRFRPPHETSALLLEGERIWAGGRDGLALFDWKKTELISLPEGTPRLERVRSLMMDRKGGLWATHSSGVELRSGGTWTHLETPLGAVGALVERRNGEIWAGGEKGLARLSGGVFRMVRDSAALGFEGVDALMEDRAGNLWTASAHPVRGGTGVLRADGTWDDFTHADGLAHSTVSALFEDRDSGIWFSCGFGKRGGASRWKDGQWKTLTKSDGLASDRVRLVREDGAGRLWVGSEVDGTAVRVGGRWRVFTPNEGMTGWEVKCVVEPPDGAIWMGTEDGVTRIRGDASELSGGPAR